MVLDLSYKVFNSDLMMLKIFVSIFIIYPNYCEKIYLYGEIMYGIRQCGMLEYKRR